MSCGGGGGGGGGVGGGGGGEGGGGRGGKLFPSCNCLTSWSRPAQPYVGCLNVSLCFLVSRVSVFPCLACLRVP